MGAFIVAPASVAALSQSDADSIYNDTVWYLPGGDNAASTCSPDTTGAGGGANGSLDRLLQAIAKHESGGNPKAANTAGGAYGKYQYIDSTWQSSAAAYYPAATQYKHASDAPEAIQDAVTYLRFSVLATKYNGSVFKIAVVQYYPAALDNPSLLDTVPAPEAGNTETVRQFANQMVDWYNNGDGSNIQLLYNQAPGFDAAKAKVGNAPALWASEVPSPQPPPDNPPSGTTSGDTSSSTTTNGCVANSGNCVQNEIAVAMSYAWPTYHSPPYLELKPAYQQAVQAAMSKGWYVGGGSNPGVDCGGFVTLVMRNSGADPNYNSGNSDTIAQKQYLDNHPELYQNLGTKTTTNGLEPGDIAINSVHTFMYTGSEGFPNYNAVSASFSSDGTSWRSPMASTAYFASDTGEPFTWYRPLCNNTQGETQP